MAETKNADGSEDDLPLPPEPGELPPEDGQPSDDDTPDLGKGDVPQNAASRLLPESEVKPDDLAIIKLLAEDPTKANDLLQSIRSQNPKQADRIAKMYQNGDTALSDALAKADPALKQAFEQLNADITQVKHETTQQRQDNERRMFNDWRNDAHPELDPTSSEGKSAQGQKLLDEFLIVVDRMIPENEPLTDELLEDALAVAKRHVNWQAPNVRKAVHQQAAEQAKKGRLGAAPKGGSAPKNDDMPSVDRSMAKEFGHADPDKLRKVSEEKRKAGFLR